MGKKLVKVNGMEIPANVAREMAAVDGAVSGTVIRSMIKEDALRTLYRHTLTTGLEMGQTGAEYEQQAASFGENGQAYLELKAGLDSVFVPTLLNIAVTGAEDVDELMRD